MARARNIKPGFFSSEQLGKCDIQARLLFTALWQIADREGRLEDRAMRIRAYAFPYDPVTPDDVEKWLSQLEAETLIERYEVGPVKVISIPKFAIHQKPHVKEVESVLPQKPGLLLHGAVPSTYLNPASTDLNPAFSHGTAISTDLNPEKVHSSRDFSALNPESGILNPECFNSEERGRVVAVLQPKEPAPPAERNGPDPDALFAAAAKLACEQLPAGGDISLTVAAIRSEFQKSASHDANPAKFAADYCASVRKWRTAYDANHDLRPKAAQWWTRDGTYAQATPKARARKAFGPIDLGENLDG